MPKITIRDTFKEFHTYHGDVFAIEQDGGCKIFSRNSENRSSLLHSFGPHIFGWLRVEQDKSPAIDTITTPLDRYTQAALSGVNPADRPTLHNNQEADEIPDFSRLSDGGLEGVVQSELANVLGGVMSLEPGTVAGQLPPSKQPPERKKRIRPSRNPAAETMAAAIAEGLIPENLPSVQDTQSLSVEEPAPKLDDLVASGLIKVGIQEPDPEINVGKILEQAEQKHDSRLNCENCKGRGVVPDPESDDPLDTVVCEYC